MLAVLDSYLMLMDGQLVLVGSHLVLMGGHLMLMDSSLLNIGRALHLVFVPHCHLLLAVGYQMLFWELLF